MPDNQTMPNNQTMPVGPNPAGASVASSEPTLLSNTDVAEQALAIAGTTQNIAYKTSYFVSFIVYLLVPVALATWLVLSGGGIYLAYAPDIIDSWFSPKADQPQEAIVGWRKQLASGNFNAALQYVYLPNRQAYRDAFIDPNNQAIEAAGQLTQIQQTITPCVAGALCRQRATVTFIDTVANDQETDINGLVAVVPARNVLTTVDLVQNIRGNWQMLDESR